MEHNQNAKQNESNGTRHYINSVVALQEHCSYKAPSKHNVKSKKSASDNESFPPGRSKIVLDARWVGSCSSQFALTMFCFDFRREHVDECVPLWITVLQRQLWCIVSHNLTF